MSTDFTWLIGGPQGSGVESGANIFSKVCAQMGYQIFGKREFYSNIKGEHSYFTVRVSDENIHSNVNDVNLMVSFDAETIFRHFDEISSDGGIIYDSELEKTDTDRVRTLDGPFKERLHKLLESKNKPFTIAGVLEIAKEKGFLVENLGDLGLSMRTNDLSVNFMRRGSAVVVGSKDESDAITLYKTLLSKI